MSKLKSKFNSVDLKEKFSRLLENIDKNNSSKVIIERYYGQLSSVEVSEGLTSSKEAYSELLEKGLEESRARHIATSSSLSESKTTIADSHLLDKIRILESAIRDFKSYTWVPEIKAFVTEGESFINTNQTYILIESVIRDLEVDKNKDYYKKAISILREASESETPDFAVVDLLESEKWIPLVKKLYEYCNTQKGAITGKNPNFKLSKIYSPIEVIDESTFAFYSSGKLLEISNKDGKITESSKNVDENFVHLANLTESSKIGNNNIRLYPSHNSVLDISFKDNTEISLNGRLIESSETIKHLMSSGIVKINEREKISKIERAIHEGSKIKEIDFGYKITSLLFEGLSASVFNVNDRIFIQKVNKGMKENILLEAESANDAVNIVKTFMNYDITESVNHLLEDEKSVISAKTKEVNKVEERIKFIIEKLAEIDNAQKICGNVESLIEAKAFILEELQSQNRALNELKYSISESHIPTTFSPMSQTLISSGYSKLSSSKDLVLGQSYTISGVKDYVYQGEADGILLFYQKDLKSGNEPLHIKVYEVDQMIQKNLITC